MVNARSLNPSQDSPPGSAGDEFCRKDAQHSVASPNGLTGETAPARRLKKPALASLVLLVAALSLTAVLWTISAVSHPAGLGAIAAIAAGAGIACALWRKDRRSREVIASLRRSLEELQDQAWELRESEERYRSVAEAFGDLVMLRDGEGTVLFVNAAMAHILGKSEAELVGRPFEWAGANAKPVMSAMDLPAVREIELDTPEGRRWFQWIELAARDERTGNTATRTIARDITNHKRAEQDLESAKRKAESANSAKSRFLGTVSHEMRTPLNGILGMAHLIRETELTPEQRAYADAIGSSGAALMGLIEDLLDLTLIEAGRFELKPVDTDPRQLVEEVCELLSAKTREKGIELASFLGPDIPHTIAIDGGRLRQVLVNLVGNAVKFTDKGGVLVSVEAERPVPGDRCWLTFAIKDTGPGMARSDSRRIFQEFEQADNATTRRHGGAGLGLSISQRIVRRLGGKISVQTAPGSGAKFSFIIPVAVVEPASDKERSALGGQSVLVISARQIESQTLARSITAAGGQAKIAETLSHAQKMIRENRQGGHAFDSLVLDPGISKNPVRSLAWLIGKHANRPHCVILVQPGMRDLRDRYLSGGFDGFLVQPVRQASLLKVLGEQREASGEFHRAGERQTPLALLANSLPAKDILLAEDNEINALLARSVLEKAGQFVTHVGNGQAAVTACRTKLAEGRNYELILMDLHMPRMDGLSAIREIRRLEARSRSVPARILTMTADEQSYARTQSTAAGSDGFITKPFDPATLLSHIKG